ncbi:hypothetical protein QBC35DRAFT_125650 [Podospora australis]|uniref:Uncharacterized protein n=1 Tax=Podospora australis TaxID=1536484 RepID=A0AAN7AEQ4_9PEZI|nr:hypothetical protein QBC35DRAFT_125650 [Podospora australis]
MGSGGYYYESEPRPTYTRPPPAVIHTSSHRTHRSSTYVVNVEGPGPRYESPSPTRVVVVEKRRRREPEPPSGFWAWFCASCCCCCVCCECCNESCCPYRDYD